MPRSIMTVNEVAASLHVSPREVVRMADAGILPAMKVKDVWHFRSGEILNWIEKHLHSLPERRRKDRDPFAPGDLLIAPTLREDAVEINLGAKTKASVLRELARLAESADPCIDAASLNEALVEREERGSTALQDGIAVPHPAKTVYSEGPVLAAARTPGGIPFGQRDGRLTDLFFLVCCPEPKTHLLYLGRLCRLLLDHDLQNQLRAAETRSEFVDAICSAETRLCGQD